MPRPGGEADKLGNKYELAWAVRYALYCIFDGRCSLTLEDIDPEVGKGSEFTYDTGAVTEAHQLKRQNGNSNSWATKTLAGLKIFESAATHVAAGRCYHFVSLVPCRPLQELSERARKSADLASFTDFWLTKELTPFFDELSAAEVLGNPQIAWTTLRGMRFSVQDEHDIVRTNSMLAGCHFSDSGHLVSLAIGDILLNNLGRRLTRTELLESLAELGIRPLTGDFRQSAHEQVQVITDSWRKAIQRELLRPLLKRAEAAQLTETLDRKRIALISGSAGSGKSSVLEQTVTSLESGGAEVLVLRLDRLVPFSSTVDLGRQLGIDTSPAVALTRAAEDRKAYLVIDQLDAVSLASGRMPESFDVVMDLIDEALSVPGIGVILACREFDIENDHRIRDLIAHSGPAKIQLGSLSAEDIHAAVTNMGLDPTLLSPSQWVLLATPLNLVLLQTIATHEDALAFQSKGSLFEAFWERKRQTIRARGHKVRFNEVLSRVATAASDRQVLSVPVELLDDDDLIEDANVLVSEHVLARDGDRIAFFHETFFDYAFARQWVSRSESLVIFLLRDEQDLFRRGQVRQILQHLYERDPERFRDEAETVLTTDAIRFHIKETVLAVISDLPAPTIDDAELIYNVAATRPRYEDQLWQRLRRPQWFTCFYEDGQIVKWLDSPVKESQERALNLMASALKEHPGPVASLLNDRKTVPEYLDWLRWVTRFADVHQGRQLFDLVLEAVQQGGYDEAEHELWLTVHNLAKHRPLWAIELLQARLINHIDAFALDAGGKVAVLRVNEYSAFELVKDAAAAEPLVLAQTIVPYLRQVMTATAMEPRENYAIRDQHFSVRVEEDDMGDRDLASALFAASVRSLETLAQSEPEAIRSMLEDLATDPYDGSQFLLYRALAAGRKNFADWAASLLLEGGRRLECGYISNPRWSARELVRAIAPHISDGTHKKLEETFRDLRNMNETHYSWGRAAFTLLSALEESRLTQTGQRRLREYQRKFHENAPSKQPLMTGGAIGSPINSASANKMTDVQWLQAISKHASDMTNWSNFTGGARELSQVLREQVAADPARFSRFALQLTSDCNAAYPNAVLMGLGDADVNEDITPLIFDAVRHIASFGQTDNDQWLGTALKKYYREVPLDLVKLIRDRMLHASDPIDNSPIIGGKGADSQGAADIEMHGINTARGSLAEALGNLLVFDSNGQKTALVVPFLNMMASDPVLSVRTYVAHTLAASLRHARPEVLTSFETLVDADDRLLATNFVQRLMLYIGNVNPEVIDPVIQRMLASDKAEVREAGGAMASIAALEWEQPALMTQAVKGDASTRKGVAAVCAGQVDRTSNVCLATETLITLMHDDDNRVRQAAAEVAPHLRNQPLRPFARLLHALIESPTYDEATPQLLITLQNAPDKVDELILKAAQRFITFFGEEAADIRTAAAGDALYISELVVRGLAQSNKRRHRTALLDVLDHLLEMGVYGINDTIAASERR